MAMPGYSLDLDLASSAKSGTGAQTAGLFSGDGFTVNIGSGSASSVKGVQVPQWVLFVGAVGAAAWFLGRHA